MPNHNQKTAQFRKIYPKLISDHSEHAACKAVRLIKRFEALPAMEITIYLTFARLNTQETKLLKKKFPWNIIGICAVLSVVLGGHWP
jgi:hypothetical protein